jgi:hypothetical protein
MGRAEPPNRAETEILRRDAWATKQETIQADESGRLLLKRPIDAWSLLLLDQIGAVPLPVR